MVPKGSLFLDQTTILKFGGCRSVFSSVFQNIAAFLLEENCWLLHLEISFAPIGVYALTGVMKLFLINLHLKVVEEQFPCYRFLPCCVFFNWGMFLLKKVDFLLHFLTRESSIFIPLTATILPLVIKVFRKCCKLPSILFWKWGALIKGPFVLFWTLKAVSFFALFLKLCGFLKVQSDLCNIFGFLLIQYSKKDIQSSIISNRIECLTK